MAAVVSGNGLGLFDTSLTQLGLGLGGNGGIGQSRERQYVNVANGNLVLQSLDEILSVRGFDSNLVRTYNSRGTVAGVGQDGWVTGYERRVALTGTLNTNGSTVSLASGDGPTVVFAYSAATGDYRSTKGDGAHDRLKWNAGTSTWTWTEGTSRRQEVFADHADAVQAGRLLQIRNLASDGTTPAQFDVLYDTQGRIIEVRSVDGAGANADAILFAYSGTTTRLTSVTTREGGATRTQVSYGYDSAGRLTTVTNDLTPTVSTDNTWQTRAFTTNDAALFRTTYTYASTAASDLRIASVTTSDGVSVAYTYEADGAGGYRVKTVTQGSSSDASQQTVTFNYGLLSTDVVHAGGKTWTYEYDAAGQLTAMLEPAVGGMRTKTSYTYDADGNLTRTSVAPGGGGALLDTVYQYDGNGNRTLQRDRAGNTVEWMYDATTNRVLREIRYTVADADGLDAGHAGNTNLPDGALATDYVYDAQGRLRFVVGASSEVVEYTYATSGDGIGQVASKRVFLGGLGIAIVGGGMFDEATLANWSGGGARANSTLLTYAYDAKGRLKQVVEYASVTQNAIGAGVLDAATAITNFTYDAQGQLLQKVVVRGAGRTLAGAPPAVSEVTDFVYDGMGRLLSTLQRGAGTAATSPNAGSNPTGAVAWDMATLLTTYAYLDSTRSVQVTFDSGLVRTETRDRAGRVSTVSESGVVAGSTVNPTTRRFYDAAGQLRAVQDAAGGRDYFFYDDAGRLIGTVDATGAVVETRYDGIGRVIQTVAYAERLDTTLWLSGSTVTKNAIYFTAPHSGLPAADEVWVSHQPLADRNAWRTYDTAGRVATETDASGLVTAYTYDGASGLVKVVVTPPGGGVQSARVTRYYHDASDRVIASLDAEDFLTEYFHDNAGRLVRTLRYATASPKNIFQADRTLEQQRPAASAADQTTRFLYDGRGQRVGMLDAEGYFTEYLYDEAGQQYAVKAYAKQLVNPSAYDLATLRSQAMSGAPAEAFRLTQRAFNALGQLVTEVNAQGTVTRLTYDGDGRLVTTETAFGVASEVRANNLRYDVFGRVIGELSGEGSTHLVAGMTEAQLDAVYAQYGVRHSYDLAGRRIESIDAKGNKTWYFHDAAGRETFVVRGIAENAAGVTGALNQYGEVRETRYNAFGEVVETIAYTGRIAIPVAGSRASVAGAIGTLSYVAATDTRRQYTYDTRGLLQSVIDAEQAQTRYTYNAFGLVSQEERAWGTVHASVTTSTYDLRGQLKTRTEGAGTAQARTQSLVYDAFGRVIQSTDARGSQVTFTWDRLGRQLAQAQTVQGRVETSGMAYDAFGRMVSSTDARGYVTTYLHSDANRSLTVTTPEGVSVTTVQNRHGQAVTVTAALGQVTEVQYDRDGRETGRTNALGQGGTQAYDARGLLSTTTDALGRTVELTYDAAGRVLQRAVDPAGLNLVTRYVYDGQGRVLRETDAAGRVAEFRYDREGRLVEVARDPAGLNLRTTYAYDAQGRQFEVTEGIAGVDVSAARTTRYAFDVLGRRISETVDPSGLALTTHYAYDANDNVIRRTDANGDATRYLYDAANRLVYTIDALGAPTRYWYDVDGNLVATRSFGQFLPESALVDSATIASIDALLDWNGTYEGSHRYYDRDGRVRYSINTQWGLEEYGYDAAGRLVHTRRYAAFSAPAFPGIDFFNGTTPASAMDATSLRDDARDEQTSRVYDAAGRLRLVVDALGNVSSITHDAAGNATVETRYAQPAALTAALRTKLAQGTATVAEILATVPTDAARDAASWSIRDNAGRLRYTIDALGVVREALLDGAGNLVGNRVYATPIALAPAAWAAGGPAALADVEAKLTAAVRDDVRNIEQYRVLDAAGRTRYTLEVVRDATGAATANLQATGYDAAGRVVSSAYQVPVATNVLTPALASLRAGTLSEATVAGWIVPSVDRATYSVHDAAGRLRYTLMQDSATTLIVRELRYDHVGRVIKEYAYGVTIPLATAKTVAAVAAAVSTAGGDAATHHRVTRYVNDDAGQLRFVIDHLGAVTERRYDAFGNVSQTRVYGTRIPVATAANVDAVAAAVAGITDVRTTSHFYDAAARLVATTDADNRTEYFGYDSIGRRTSHTNKLGHTWLYTFDAAGRLTTETSPTVAVASTDASGNVTSSNRSVVTTYGYDALGNLVSRTEDAGQSTARTTTWTYDNRGNQIRTTLPLAGVLDPATGVISATGTAPTIDVVYDSLGQAVVQKDVRGHHSYKVYNALGQIAFEIDQTLNVTAFHYNAWGERTSTVRYEKALNTGVGAFAGWTAGTAMSMAQVTAGIVTGADRTIFTGYTQLGQKRAVTQLGASYFIGDGNLLTGNPRTEFTYNAYGELVRESVLLEGAPGQPSAVWAHTWHYYDAVGRNTLTVDAEGYATSVVYNAIGEVVEQTAYARALAPDQRGAATAPPPPAAGDAVHGFDRITRWTYDALGRKASETVVRNLQRVDGTYSVRDVATTYTYDAEGRLATATADAGPGGAPATARTTYDALGRVIGVQEAARSVVQANGDAVLTGSTANNLTSGALYVTVSPYTALAYDAFGNVVQSHQYANGRDGTNAPVADAERDRITTMRYDGQGRAVWEKNALGHVVIRTFDAADNITEVRSKLTGNDGRWSDVVTTMGYDAIGRQISTQTLRYQYSNPTTFVGVATDGTESVGYNAFGEISEKGYSLTERDIKYHYDAAGRLIRSNEGGFDVNYGYNLAGHQVRQWHDAWTTTGTTLAVTLTTVDKLGRAVTTRLPSHTATTTDTSTITQRFDRWGNVLQVIDTRGYQTDYRYNELDQVTYEARPLVQVLSAAGVASWQRPINRWFHDVFGRLLGTQDANGNVRTNEFDAHGRLVMSKDALGNATRYAYDSFGGQRLTQNALGYITFSEYDKAGRVVVTGDYLKTQAGDARTRTALQSFVLNEHGDRSHVIDALGYGTRYDYDSRNLLLRSQTQLGTVVEYAYDARGSKTLEKRLQGTAYVDRDGETVHTDQLTWKYDAFGRLSDHNNLSGRDHDYVYDPASGRMRSESAAGGIGHAQSTLPDASRVIHYYANGRIRKIEETSGYLTTYYTYEYDSAGNRTYEEIYTGDAGGLDGSFGIIVHSITRSVYDSNNRLQRVVQDDAVQNKRVFDLVYDYDAAGNRRRVRASSGYGPNVPGVSAANAAPVAVQASLGDRVVRAGIASEFRWLLTDVFRDAEADAITVSTPTLANGAALPSWLTYTFDAQTGALVFSVAAGSSAALDQDLEVRIQAGDAGHANAAQTTFVLKVRTNTAPTTVGASPTYAGKTGRPWQMVLNAEDHFFDPDVGDSLRLSIVDKPAWMSASGSGTGALHFAANVATPTIVSVTIRATDDLGGFIDRVVNIAFGVNVAPSAVAQAGVRGITGRDLAWNVPLSQVFTDANGDALTVTATLASGQPLPAWLQFTQTETANPQLQIAGTVPPAEVAGTVYTVRLTATDPDGATATTDLVVTIGNNLAPVAQNQMREVQVGVPFEAVIAFDDLFLDPEGDALSLETRWPSGSSLPAWLGVDVDYVARTVRLSGTPYYLQRGDYPFELRATDIGGLAASATLTIRVVNTPPVASSLPNRQAATGANVSWTLPPFTDANGDALTYTATTLPSWLSFNATTRTLSGQAPSTAGTHTVTIAGSDGNGGSTSASFSISVIQQAQNTAPRVANPPAGGYEITGGSNDWAPNHSFSLPDDTFVDDDGHQLSYTTIGMPAWLSYWHEPGVGHQFYGQYPGPFPTSGVTSFTLRASDGLAVANVTIQVEYKYRDGEAPPIIDSTSPGAEEDSASAGGFQSLSTPVETTEYWFTYDAENRIKIDRGRFSGGQIVLGNGATPSVEVLYDAAGRVQREVTPYGGVTSFEYDERGNRVIEYHSIPVGAETGSNGIARRYIYAGDRLQEVRNYYGNEQEVPHPSPGYPTEIPEWGMPMRIGGWLESVEQYTYDAEGRLLTQVTHMRPGKQLPEWSDSPDDILQMNSLTVLPYETSRVDYTGGYDAAGRLASYSYKSVDIHSATHTFTLQYEGWSDYKEKVVAGTSTNSTYKANTNSLFYDGYGRLREQREKIDYQGVDKNYARVYSNTYEGLVLTRREGERNSGGAFQQQAPANGGPYPNYLFVYAGGQQQAELKEGGAIRTGSGYSYTPRQLQGLNGTGRYTAGGGKVTVLEGESLRDIAQRVYGSAQLWYVLADANGLSSPEATPAAGTQINAPSVNVSSNDSATFKPYNPNEAIGATSPGLPYIVPPPKQQSNALAMIIMIVVAVVVTVVTWGAGTAMFPSLGPVAGAMVNAGVSTFLGSVASQAVGSAMGATSFSWRTAVEAGVTASLSAGLTSSGPMKSLMSALDKSKFLQGAVEGVAAQVTSYAGSKIAGVDVSFNWGQVAASAVSQGVMNVSIGKYGDQIADALGFDMTKIEGQFKMKLLSNFAGGTVSMHAGRQLGYGGEINYGRVAADAFGNAIGLLAAGRLGIAAAAASAERARTIDTDADARRAFGWPSESLETPERLPLSGLRNPLHSSYRPEWFYPGPGGPSYESVRPYLTASLQSMEEAWWRDDRPRGNAIDVVNGNRILRGESRPRTDVGFPVHPVPSSRDEQVWNSLPVRDPPLEIDIVWRLSPPPALSLDFETIPNSLPTRGQEVPENVMDSVLLSMREGGGWLRNRSTSILDNADSHWMAAAGASIYAVNTLTATVLDGVVDLGRLLTSSQQRGEFVAGMGTLLTTNPVTTATVGWEMWSELSLEDRARHGGAVIAGFGSIAARLAKVNGLAPKFKYVDSHGLRGEVPLTELQRAEVETYLSKFDLEDVAVRFVDDKNLNTGYLHGDFVRILQVGSDVVPGNAGLGSAKANSRISIKGALAHEIVGHRESILAGRAHSVTALDEAQASIRAARFAPDLTSTERYTLLRDGIYRLRQEGMSIRDHRHELYIDRR